MADKNRPELIEDAQLDDTAGGIGMLLPAVQKVREAAAKTSSSSAASPEVKLAQKVADGSV